MNFIEPAGDPGYRQRIAGDEPARGISRNAIAGDETPDADDAALVALVAQMLPEDQSGQALAAFQRIARDDDDEITRKPVASIVDRAKALWSMVRLIGARLDGELDDRLPLFRHAVRALRGDQTFDDSVEPRGPIAADQLLHDQRRHRLVLRRERGHRRLQRLARGLALIRQNREDRLEPRRADRGRQAAVARLVDVIPVQARVVAGAPDRRDQQFRRGGDIVPRMPIFGVPPLASILDDRYRLLRELGRGGMGVVYAAEATRLGDRPCAVKLLRPEFTHDAVAVARFRREAAVAARIKHPNVVEIFDTGTTASGLGYIAMELLTGETLAHTLRRAGRLPWTRVRRLLLQICGALAAAHAQQVVHRDMKPDNCLLLGPDEPDEIIKILDFGIAKRTFADDPRLTATDALVGTHAYMSCEQVRGEDVDPRTDVWSVGVILYELLTGLLPFRGRNAGQIWTAITNYDPEPLASVAPDAGIPADVDDIVRRTLARALPDRFPSIAALAQALAAVPDGPASASPSRPRLPGPVIVVDPLATTHSHTAGPVPADSRHDRFVRVRDLVLAGALFIALQVVVAAIAVFVGIRLLAP